MNSISFVSPCMSSKPSILRFAKSMSPKFALSVRNFSIFAPNANLLVSLPSAATVTESATGRRSASVVPLLLSARRLQAQLVLALLVPGVPDQNLSARWRSLPMLALSASVLAQALGEAAAVDTVIHILEIEMAENVIEAIETASANERLANGKLANGKLEIASVSGNVSGKESGKESVIPVNPNASSVRA